MELLRKAHGEFGLLHSLIHRQRAIRTDLRSTSPRNRHLSCNSSKVYGTISKGMRHRVGHSPIGKLVGVSAAG